MHLPDHRPRVLSQGIMVDVEAAGPVPTVHPLLSIGACVVARPYERFYVELRPDRATFLPEALAICKLDMDELRATGEEPADALRAFTAWARAVHGQPLFVAHNAPFDWMFVQCYLGTYDVANPFGHWALDTLAAYGPIMTTPLPHHAGEDAYLQALDLRRYYGIA